MQQAVAAPAATPAAAPAAPATSAQLPTGLTVRGEVLDYTPVTDDMLRTPAPGDWLMVRRNYQGWSHSPLRQVTRDNVKNLRLAWVWAMNEGGPSQPMPVAHDGTLYLVHTGNVVQALNGETGDLIWEYRAGPDQGGAMRNMAIYEDKVFAATSDARMVALDARTGELAWESRFADPEKGYAARTGPIVINGKLIQGLNGCGRFKEDGCFISALDAATGRVLWRFNTVARPEEPGGETWGDQPMMFRAGGETWITGSYDPELNLTYWGTAQAKPWVPASRGMTALDSALYTSSTVALNPDDGTLDLDEVFERVLVDLDGRKLVFTIGKPGILWKLDRQTGEFLGHKETIFQNIFESIDPHDRHTHLSRRHHRGTRRRVGPGLPEYGRRSQLAGHELSPRDQPVRDPAEPDVPGDLRTRGRVHGRVGRHGSGPTVVRDARVRRPTRQACRIRCENDGGGVELRTASCVPDVGALDGRRRRVRRRPRPYLPRVRRTNWRHSLADSARHVGAGLPDFLHRERKAVHRRDDGSRGRQPAQRAATADAGHQASAER